MDSHSSLLYFHSLRKRATAALLSIVILFSFFVFVLFKMQIIDFEEYSEKVLDEITVGSALNAKRGEIYDRNGNLLASSSTVWRAFLSPVDIKTYKKDNNKDPSENIAKGLSEILSVSYESILSKAKKSRTLDQTVIKGIDETKKEKVLKFITDNSYENIIHLEASYQRYYPLSDFASHLIGFTGSDGQGLFGIEAYYDSYLKGQNGRYIYTKDAKGNSLENGYISYEEAVDGATVKTTIDLYIQRVLEEYVEKAEVETGAKNRVCAAVIDVNDGAILGMATSGAYDLNSPYTLTPSKQSKLYDSGYEEGSDEYKALKSELLYEMWNNKVISEIYEPGSTFKVITASIALDSNKVTANDRFSCTGSYKVGGYTISCHKKTGHE